MDLTSALILCSNILSFMYTSRKLLAGTSELSHFQTGLKGESVHIDALIENFRQLTAKLDPGCVEEPNHGIALESIAKNSEKLAKKVALKSTPKERSAADILKILADYQRLALHQDKQDAVGQQFRNLESEASNLCAENTTRVSKLKEDLLTVAEELLAQETAHETESITRPAPGIVPSPSFPGVVPASSSPGILLPVPPPYSAPNNSDSLSRCRCALDSLAAGMFRLGRTTLDCSVSSCSSTQKVNLSSLQPRFLSSVRHWAELSEVYQYQEPRNRVEI
ncbi:hypothetical protein B0T26DRAFT_755032 [Lasiosphaeria miniovina]|uniref:Uncharacterized protein n=1 Tax=Lasiosphaeria miniovina TaxID=1954250 RepID=A0AA40DQN1_9PEZI|nr:uncharacterized protein B0T26DRAFT_755032 [Lasiosphaeria miniovina]KAK0709896.1 hypothetical protein B0T26DRAFT_755032 [Lasiosphaeria miniovina]